MLNLSAYFGETFIAAGSSAPVVIIPAVGVEALSNI